MLRISLGKIHTAFRYILKLSDLSFQLYEYDLNILNSFFIQAVNYQISRLFFFFFCNLSCGFTSLWILEWSFRESKFVFFFLYISLKSKRYPNRSTVNYSSDTDWWISDQEDELQQLPVTPTFDNRRQSDIRSLMVISESVNWL